MKPSRAFWGLFFVVFGALFLINRNFDINLGWTLIWKFWPLIFVFIGIAVMLKGTWVKWVLSGLAGIGAAVFLYGAVSFSWLDLAHAEFDEDAENMLVQEFSEPLPAAIKKASLTLDAAAGRYTVDTVAGQLFHTKITTSIGRFTLVREATGDAIHLRFKPDGQVRVRNWRMNRAPNNAEIRLNTSPVWDINVNAGAAEVDFDLSPFRIENLNIESGAASVKLKLGMPEREMRCTIKAGASSVRVSIPEEAACEITTNGGLSSTRFEGFEKVGEDRYQTSNFENAAKKIFINADAGVSSIRVRKH